MSQLSLYVSSVLELASFVGYFYYLGFVFVVLSCLFIAALGPPAGKGLNFYCVFVNFPCGVLTQVWYIIVSISELCLLTSLGGDDTHSRECEDWMLSYVLMKI